MLATLLLLAAPPALADTVAIQPTADTMLCEDQDSSNGAGNYVFVGNTGQSAGLDGRRALLRFDVAGAVPAGSAVTSAELAVEVDKVALPGPSITVTLHPLTTGFGEAGSAASMGEGACAQALPGDATWLDAVKPGTPWSTPGGDFLAAPSAGVAMQAVGSYTFASTANTVRDVQFWLDTPGSAHGWLLLGGESLSTSAKRMTSREHASGGAVLTIEFTPPPGPTGTTGSTGLMADTGHTGAAQGTGDTAAATPTGDTGPDPSTADTGAPPDTDVPADTGPTDTDVPTDTGGTPPTDTDGVPDTDVEDDSGGCGCATGSPSGWAAVLPLLALAARRRR